MNETLMRINVCGIVPVIKLNDAGNAVPLADALFAGGIDVMEITFRTPAARDAIERVSRSRPEMLVGAGTVLNEETLNAAKDAGAKFIVSPGLNPATVRVAQNAGLPIIPGVLTPTEIELGLSLGIEVFKFFPAENFGGISAVHAIAAPYGNIKFVPTGGINADNASDYFKSDKVFAVGGSWMVTEELTDSGDWAEITRLTREATTLLKIIRHGR
ncbi:MAG: bifunctional 4-hydroxy-2-oxoglutarate aldolase/2-dehydro-3-deoxy-phosphogluconate aldolase [Oscillospiraceae bacterium]|jgi:2-dehydro-3-deoxyphosphogluconate aldolase/(4S)-4-hydroxy-2-oxoglutarate aldolase|nr:bifunctional 4-hydroxy-2-oxoglutarate aldolase/2-dehydro-3-deoxy-phosphogluconate aldolase [Oscillospiraceae bacterium]